MILYLDTSALVKRYIFERGTAEVALAMREAAVSGTSMIARAEMAAAFAKAVRTNILSRDVAAAALGAFHGEWPRLVRVQITELLVAQADNLAWEFGLRGYDAVHLASALLWQQGLDSAVAFATFDLRLWDAANQRGLPVLPLDLPALVATWRS